MNNWLVFWAPSARPLQNGPAISAMAVNARPLSLTVTTEATIIAATLQAQSAASDRVSVSMATAAATAITRIGRSREPTRSDHRPAPTRPSAPSTCARVTSAPAEPADQPLSAISHTRVNVHTTLCGMTSSTDTR